jgi:hypothetical protein
MLSRERLCKVMTKPWRQAASFPMIDCKDNFGITAEHDRHCRRFCDGQSLHVQREPTAFNKERATDSISINYKL